MKLDNKEFWALKASDVIKAYKSIMQVIDRDIKVCEETKMSEKEINEWEELSSLDAIHTWLEGLREEIEDILWIDQFGDEIPK